MRDPNLTTTVETLLGVRVITEPDRTDQDRSFVEMAGFAVRDNPRRAHLIVSRVLGKHIPVPGATILGAGYALADKVAEAHPGLRHDESALVLGFCETATGLGHAVAEVLGVTYLHTTRRPQAHREVAIAFEEEHSHAVAHSIQPDHTIHLSGAGALVLVDDELTTGTTALNTIEVLEARFPRPRYHIATLLDARTPQARAAFEARAATMGVEVDVTALLTAHLDLPENILVKARAAHAALPAPAPPVLLGDAPATVHIYDNLWPAPVPCTARHGMNAARTATLVSAAEHVALALLPSVIGSAGVLVLGTEELLHVPTHVADRLARHLTSVPVLNQSTTRSPVHAADDPGYAIRRTVTFACPDDPTRASLVHNLVDPSAEPPPGQAWADLRHDDIVIVVDAPVRDCASLVQAVRPYATRAVHLVVLPVT